MQKATSERAYTFPADATVIVHGGKFGKGPEETESSFPSGFLMEDN